ncbi:MAG: DUF2935 domain-containing protein [Oscillospiraceae bacterium]|nr:DUF2935 domain-containing protein [Oscillospiraceae bacterium]
MNRMQDYVVHSLEKHLFFALIMKEHAFFLKVGFLPPNADLAKEGEQLLRQFEALLSRAITLSNGVVGNCVLESGEIVTDFTDCAEQQTCHFTGTALDRELTSRAKKLQGRDCKEELKISKALVQQVQQLNRDALMLLERLINFKERVLCAVNSCKLFTVNYPLLIEHILREARLYRANLLRLEGRCDRKCQELRDSELFWNQIMMEHAMFIRGLLDPSEAELTDTADDFAEDYSKLLEAARTANDRVMDCNHSRELTTKFRDFKQAGVEGIENCQIRSIILPLLADHVLREANHYLRLLEQK